MHSIFSFFFLMRRRPPRSTQGVSSAASDVYKRQHGDDCPSEDNLDKEVLNQILPMRKKPATNCKVKDNLRSIFGFARKKDCLLYTSPSPRDLSTSRMPSSA
eukprot:TRINITY_DN61252_c0_g1_i1.p2 TRINITY_DN61252_c0_g1~~TRINITY_DN61252_c0_g1_i1.p2  ORF type:complete len:102 (-),score=29.14 TRINITY_DN61252_c0_g1_i1:107-412(-)